MSTELKKVTTSKAIEVLKRNDITVDDQQAKEILDFLYFLAGLVVEKYLNDELQ